MAYRERKYSLFWKKLDRNPGTGSFLLAYWGDGPRGGMVRTEGVVEVDGGTGRNGGVAWRVAGCAVFVGTSD